MLRSMVPKRNSEPNLGHIFPHISPLWVPSTSSRQPAHMGHQYTAKASHGDSQITSLYNEKEC
jgi:hypothetical protein